MAPNIPGYTSIRRAKRPTGWL